MCEPTNSIIQYPYNDGNGTPTEDRLGAWKKVLEWGKRVADWLHFSRMGSGHHEAAAMVGTFYDRSPAETRYESLWWDRTVKLDGTYHGQDFDQELALDAATGYAEAVSIGSLTALRRFLETSLRRSDMRHLYVAAFLDNFLNKGGRNAFSNKLKSVFGVKYLDLYELFGPQVQPERCESLIKCVLGFTRKRELLVPAWADDTKLWVPEKPALLLPAS